MVNMGKSNDLILIAGLFILGSGTLTTMFKKKETGIVIPIEDRLITTSAGKTAVLTPAQTQIVVSQEPYAQVTPTPSGTMEVYIPKLLPSAYDVWSSVQTPVVTQTLAERVQIAVNKTIQAIVDSGNLHALQTLGYGGNITDDLAKYGVEVTDATIKLFYDDMINAGIRFYQPPMLR